MADRQPQAAPGYRTKTEWAHLQMLSWIQTGALAPGERLEQERLAAALDVSRDPLRSALVRLQAEGLVVSRPHAGFTVAALSLSEARDVYACREAVESMLARTAATEADGDVVSQLEELLARQRRAGADAELLTFLELDRAFHQTLYEGSQFTQSLDIVTRLRDLSDRYVLTFLRYQTHVDASLAQHEALLQACRVGDADALERATRHHISQGLADLTSIVDGGDGARGFAAESVLFDGRPDSPHGREGNA